MSTSKVTGIIDGISDYKKNDFFNIALDDSDKDDNWYIGDGTLRDYGELEKGDKVRLHFDDNQGSVTKVDIMETGASEDEATRGSDSDNKQSYGGSTGSDSYSSKDDRINKKVAFKEAAETLRTQEEDVDLNHGEHIEALAGLANGYYNILKELGGDK